MMETGLQHLRTTNERRWRIADGESPLLTLDLDNGWCADLQDSSNDIWLVSSRSVGPFLSRIEFDPATGSDIHE